MQLIIIIFSAIALAALALNYVHPDVVKHRKILKKCHETYSKCIERINSNNWSEDIIIDFLKDNNIDRGVCNWIRHNFILPGAFMNCYWINRNVGRPFTVLWCLFPLAYEHELMSSWKQSLIYREAILKDEYEHILIFGYCARFFKPL